jgi:uncharacterized protein with ParB-like and HNH nuclease domain
MAEPILGLLTCEKAKEGKQAINAPDWVKSLLDIRLIKKPYLKHNTQAVTSVLKQTKRYPNQLC